MRVDAAKLTFSGSQFDTMVTVDHGMGGSRCEEARRWRRSSRSGVGRVMVGQTAFARSAFEKVQRLLSVQQPTGLDRVRSTGTFDEASVRVELYHVSGHDQMRVDLHYGADDLGGMFNPLGYEEYYRPPGAPPVEQDALDDLAVVLTSTYTIEETYWSGKRIRTVVTQSSGGEEVGGSISGWPLLPPKWFLTRRLTVRRESLSYSCHTTPA